MRVGAASVMAEEGVIDGDTPFNELVQSMSRQSFVESARNIVKAPSGLAALEKAASMTRLPTPKKLDDVRCARASAVAPWRRSFSGGVLAAAS